MNLKKISLFFQKNINYLILITLALLIFSITFGSSLLETLKLIKTRNDLTKQIEQAEELNTQLDEEIALIGSQGYIERIARQYLELYYPNEQIVIPVENSLKNQNKTDQNQQEQTTQNQEENITEEPTITEEPSEIEEPNDSEQETTTDQTNEEITDENTELNNEEITNE